MKPDTRNTHDAARKARIRGLNPVTRLFVENRVRPEIRATRLLRRNPDGRELTPLGAGLNVDDAVVKRPVGDQKLECELTVKGGRVVWDLNGLPRPSWTEQKKGS